MGEAKGVPRTAQSPVPGIVEMMLWTGRSGSRRVVLLAALVIGLVTGLIGMHHLTAGDSGPHRVVAEAGTAESMPAPAPDATMHRDDMPDAPAPAEHGDTGLWHLCLAIVTGIALVGAVLVQWRTGATPTARPSSRTSRPAPAPRAPPSAPARLALLCVLRT